MKEIFHHLDDIHDKSLWGTGEPDIPKELVRRHNEWAALQEPQPNYFCEHSSYVGYDRSLAYLCPKCPET